MSADKNPTASQSSPTMTSFLSFCCPCGILLFSLVSDYPDSQVHNQHTHTHTHLKLQTRLPTGLQVARPCQDHVEPISVVCQDLKFDSVCCGLSRVGRHSGGAAWGLLSSQREEPGPTSLCLPVTSESHPYWSSPAACASSRDTPFFPPLFMSSPTLAFLRVLEHQSRLSASFLGIPINEA